MIDTLQNLDYMTFFAINDSDYPLFWRNFFKLVSENAFAAGLVLLSAAIAATLRKTRFLKIMLLGVVVLGLSDAICFYVLKPAFARPRPCYQFDTVNQSQKFSKGLETYYKTVYLKQNSCGGIHSFPSNHASNAMAVIGVIFSMLKTRKRYLLLAIPLIVSFSRIYIGVHYPGDVIFGMTVGALLAWLAVRFSRSRLAFSFFREK